MKRVSKLPIAAALLVALLVPALLVPATPALAAALKVSVGAQVVAPSGAPSAVSFVARPSKRATVRVAVYSAGRAIRSLAAKRSGSQYVARWNLRTSKGARVKPGAFAYRVTARAAGGAKVARGSVRVPSHMTSTALGGASAGLISGNRWVGLWMPGAPSNMSLITSLESQVGHVSVVHLFMSDSDGLPVSHLNNIAANGSIPLVTLEFWSTQKGGLTTITNGSRDAKIKALADQAKGFGKTIWLRPFHEMNGNWYPWGKTGSNTSAQSVAAYRHVHDIFKKEGATNVKFVWCPNVDFNVSSYYPGDAYVDYAAMDGYNTGSPWRSFSNLFGATYDSVTAVTAKPIIIAETGCVEGGSGKAAWITDMFAEIHSQYTHIVGIVWFDEAKGSDWRVDTSASSLAAFAAGATSGF